MKTLTHLTITTGDSRPSPRSEVTDETLQVLRPLVERVAAGERVEVPWVEPRCVMTGAREGSALVVTVWGPPLVEGLEVPLVTFGVAPREDDAAGLWEALQGTGARPAAPWCAVRIYPSVGLHPEAVGWLGDFERCVAWTWIERGARN